MAKALDAPYEAGRRGAGWLKIKSAHTLDLVVLAAEWGSGRRKRLALQPAPRRARPGDRRLRDARQDLQGPHRRDARVADARAARARDRRATTGPSTCGRSSWSRSRSTTCRRARTTPAGSRCASRASRATARTSAPDEADTIDTVRAIYERGRRVKSLAEWLAFIERQHPQPIALGLDRVPRGLCANENQLAVSGDHRRRHQRQGLDLRDARVDPARRRATAPASTPRRTCCATTSACASPGARRATRRCARPSRRSSARAAGVPLTYFEFGTLAAFCTFRQAELERADPRGRPGRPARRGERRSMPIARCSPASASTMSTTSARPRVDRPREGGHLPRRPAGGDRRAGSAASGAAARSADEAAPRAGTSATRRRARSGPTGGPRGKRPGLAHPALRGGIQLRNAARGAVRARRARALPVAMQDVRRGLAEVDAARRASRCCRAGRR